MTKRKQSNTEEVIDNGEKILLTTEEFSMTDSDNNGIDNVSRVETKGDGRISEMDINKNKYEESDKVMHQKSSTLENNKVINLGEMYRLLKKRWWMLLLNCVIVGVITSLLIVEEPRTYTSEVKLAPEAENDGGGTLSSIASSFGIDLGNMSSADAIRPDLYPDLVSSTDFIMQIFKIPVKTLDGNIYTDYYTYLKKYQKSSWWRKNITEFMKKFKSEPPVRKTHSNKDDNGGDGVPTRVLSSDEEKMIEGVKGSVICSVDRKTYIISILVEDQDPLIAATVADSVSSMIQNFVTDYRTNKATKDYRYYYGLLIQAKDDYEKACAEYAKYVDTHRDVILQTYLTERDQLENDMQVKLNTYNAMLTQVNNAKAKIQETTPAFTILQHAYVPVMPTGPKRMIFVITWVFLTFVFTAFFICKGHISDGF